MASYQYIYVMKGLNRVYPGGKQVLKDIWLSFFPGAKIGVLGLNGAGKSSLLRIMAGLDQDFAGEAWPADGVRVGFLPQEPELDPAKDVLGNVMEGVGETKALLDRFEAVSARFAEEMTDDEMTALIAEQSELQEKIDATNAWDLDRTIEIAMDALRCPPGDADVSTLSGGERRRVALCRLLLRHPDLLLLDEPTNHLDAESVAWLERFLHDYDGTVVAVTHDRYFLDNVAGWILELDRGHGIPWEGNYSSWLDQKQKRLEQEGKQEAARQRTLKHELEWIGQSPRARQAKAKARVNAYERLLAEATNRAPDSAQIVIPPGPRLGDAGRRGQGTAQGLWRPVADRGSRLHPAAGRAGRRDRAQRRRQDDLVPHDRGAGAAGRRQPDPRRPVVLGYVDQSRDTLNADKTVWEEISGRAGRDRTGQGRDPEPRPTWAASTSRARTSRRRSASSRAASATGSIWPRY